jgi:hypothetical protein
LIAPGAKPLPIVVAFEGTKEADSLSRKRIAETNHGLPHEDH